MIEGDQIYIRAMELEDVKHKVQWLNDKEVRKSLIYSDYPASVLATEQWLRRVVTDPTRKDFIVCLKSEDVPIGFAGLRNIDRNNQKAESYLGIGAKEYWGRGLGLDIKQALLDYCFDELKLNKIYSQHLVDNQAMIKINKRLGGKEEGVLRQEIWHNGQFRDMVIISILKSEYIKLNLQTHISN